jgi:hypothetical protein
MPCLRHRSPGDIPAACSFSTLMICYSVNLLLRMSVSRRNELYPKTGASTGAGQALLESRAFELYHQVRAECFTEARARRGRSCERHGVVDVRGSGEQKHAASNLRRTLAT